MYPKGDQKRLQGALGWLLRASGAQLVFNSLVPVAGGDVGRNRQTQSINTWLSGWCRWHNFWLFWQRDGLHGTRLDGIHLS